MRGALAGVALLTLAAAKTAPATAQDSGALEDDIAATLAAMCGAIGEPMDRLACYDSLMVLFEASNDPDCPEAADAVLRATIVDWDSDIGHRDGDCVIGLSVQSVGHTSDGFDALPGDVMEMVAPCSADDTTLTIGGQVTVSADQPVEAHVQLMCGIGMLRPVWDAGGIRPIGPARK